MSKTQPGITRRNLLKTAAIPSAAALLLPSGALSQAQSSAFSTSTQALPDLPILAQPDLVIAFAGDIEPTRYALSRTGTAWTCPTRATGLRVSLLPAERQLKVALESPTLPVQRIHLRWHCRLPVGTLALGDAWERSYGDLDWRPLQAERALPWYAMLHLHQSTAGMGVKTGAAAFAFWQADPAGISLWLDTRNGGNGVQLGTRQLDLATIVTCRGAAGESPFAATQRLCRLMAAGTPVPARRGATSLDVLYGSNDWYYAYGNNTADGILRDADLVASLAPANGPRPFTVIDDGYQEQDQAQARSRFPDLPALAASIRRRDVLPGIWIRPLRAPATTPRTLLLPAARFAANGTEPPPLAYDPTIPEALEAVAAIAAEARAWGFDLIKHDFTTFELLGQWGSQMGASPTRGNWRFDDRSRTNAEIVTALYRRLRAASGEDRVILGCNTIGHLAVGLFDASRTGDDVSGRAWERTRRMGVNTLAFRLPQHRTFFALDADCVPLTPDVPWSMTRQWLELVANSGTVLLVSPNPKAIGAEQRSALREAFAQCAQRPSIEPLDWTATRTPQQWRSAAVTHPYNWILPEGESPFPIGIERGPD